MNRPLMLLSLACRQRLGFTLGGASPLMKSYYLPLSIGAERSEKIEVKVQRAAPAR